MLHIAHECGGCLQHACNMQHHAASQKLHVHLGSAFRTTRPRRAGCRTLRRGAAQIVSASPLNEGSTDADVRAVKESGDLHDQAALVTDMPVPTDSLGLLYSQ